MDVRPVQPWKALFPIVVTELGNSMDVRPVQPWKALFPIVVTELGMSMDVNPVQPWKALFPIVVIELGNSIDVRLVQFLNARASILVTEYVVSLYVISAGILKAPEYLGELEETPTVLSEVVRYFIPSTMKFAAGTVAVIMSITNEIINLFMIVELLVGNCITCFIPNCKCSKISYLHQILRAEMRK